MPAPLLAAAAAPSKAVNPNSFEHGVDRVPRRHHLHHHGCICRCPQFVYIRTGIRKSNSDPLKDLKNPTKPRDGIC